MMRRGGAVRRKVHAILGALVLAGALAGCTSARSSLGTTDSSCFLALPTASSAVHDHGYFMGIHLFTRAQLAKVAPRMANELAEADEAATHLCVAAYSGTFTSTGVQKAMGRPAGKLAIVVVNASTRKLLATVIFRHLPLRFSHTHLG